MRLVKEILLGISFMGVTALLSASFVFGSAYLHNTYGPVAVIAFFVSFFGAILGVLNYSFRD